MLLRGFMAGERTRISYSSKAKPPRVGPSRAVLDYSNYVVGLDPGKPRGSTFCAVSVYCANVEIGRVRIRSTERDDIEVPVIRMHFTPDLVR